jgi:hypothetical protein
MINRTISKSNFPSGSAHNRYRLPTVLQIPSEHSWNIRTKIKIPPAIASLSPRGGRGARMVEQIGIPLWSVESFRDIRKAKSNREFQRAIQKIRLERSKCEVARVEVSTNNFLIISGW